MGRHQKEWDNLDKDRRHMLYDYLKEMEPVNGIDKVRFTKRECSCCGEVGFVPEHHRFLCVFCWVTAHYFDDPLPDILKAMRETPDYDSGGRDKVATNIPIGIEGIGIEPEVYSTTIYSSDDYSQEELQAMIS